MSSLIRFSNSSYFSCLIAAIALSAICICSSTAAEAPAPSPSAQDGLLDKLFSFQANLHILLQDYVNQSIKGVKEAMHEGGTPTPPPDPFTIKGLEAIRDQNAAFAAANKGRADIQDQILNVDRQILSKLPQNDPRRAGLLTEMMQMQEQRNASRQAEREFTQKVANANATIEGMKKSPKYTETPSASPPTGSQAEGSPSPPPGVATTGDSTAGAPSSGPPGPPLPPQIPIGPGATGGELPTIPTGPPTWGGGTGTEESHHGGLDALKSKEATLEAEARALGKEREAAVLKYHENPTPENKAEAQALKKRVDELVGRLNKVRNQVDSITGKSRGDLRVKTAKQIIESNRRSAGTGSGEEHHDASGRDIPSTKGRQYDVSSADVPAAGPKKQGKTKTVSSHTQKQDTNGANQNTGKGAHHKKAAVGSTPAGQVGASQAGKTNQKPGLVYPTKPQRKRPAKSAP